MKDFDEFMENLKELKKLDYICWHECTLPACSKNCLNCSVNIEAQKITAYLDSILKF